jgi:cysteine desulfuration protein SufE
MKTMREIQDELIAEFSVFDDWMDKYELIIDLGSEYAGMPESDKIEAHLVRGCQSKVWIKPRMQDGLLYFDFDSDALITKGIAGLIIRVVSGHSPVEVAFEDLYFIDLIGFKEHLSPNRANGLVSMLQKIRTYALTADKTTEK